MRVLLVFVLFVGLCHVNGYTYEDRELKGGGLGEWKEGGWRVEGYERKCDDKENKDEKCDEDDRKCYEEGTCDYSNEKYFYEPCDYSDDEDCVRKFFGTYGQCQIVHYEDKKPVFREKYVAYLPNINLTLIPTKTRIRGLKGKIEQFYVNKKTGNLVFAVNFDGIELSIKRGIFIFHRRGREPIVVKEFANVTYPVILTSVIPLEDGLSLKALKKSRVTPFFPVQNFEFFIGPRVAGNKDPTVAESYAGLVANIPTAIKEIFLTEAPNFFLAYLQKYICDYGIPLSGYPNIQALHQEQWEEDLKY